MLLDTPADLSAEAVPWYANAAGPAIAHETRRSLARRILMEHLPKEWIRMRPDRGRGKGEFGPPLGELQALHLRRRKCQSIRSERVGRNAVVTRAEGERRFHFGTENTDPPGGRSQRGALSA